VPQSITLLFTDPTGFVAAIPYDETSRHLVITGHGRFRARLTWVALNSLRLVAGEESLARITFVTVPNDMVLVVLRREPYSAPIWGEIVLQAQEMLTFGPGSRAHVRTDGPSRWATVLVPVRDLARYGRRIIGKTFTGPNCTHRWVRPSVSYRNLRYLHTAAIRAVETGHPELISEEAAHGLDQQIMEALVECFSVDPIVAHTPTMRRYCDIMARLEALLDRHYNGRIMIAELGAALGVSPWTLGRACQIHLGISAASYVRLRRMQRRHPAQLGESRGVPGIDLHQ
jgi:AraC-like DNA-binding protein